MGTSVAPCRLLLGSYTTRDAETRDDRGGQLLRRPVGHTQRAHGHRLVRVRAPPPQETTDRGAARGRRSAHSPAVSAPAHPGAQAPRPRSATDPGARRDSIERITTKAPVADCSRAGSAGSTVRRLQCVAGGPTERQSCGSVGELRTSVRISLQSDHSFRSKLTTHFGRI